MFQAAMLRPSASPAVTLDTDAEPLTAAEVARSLGAPLLLIIAVLGSILGGLASPTEASAIGAGGALLLAGLRLGYLIGCADLIAPILGKTRDSYNVDAVAQVLAEAALTDIDYSQNNWETINRSRDSLQERLISLGFEVPSSQANFLLARSSTAHKLGAKDLYDALHERDIFVRYFSQLPDRLRITVGTEAENETLLNALSNLLND